jgi:hypothetical protein
MRAIFRRVKMLAGDPADLTGYLDWREIYDPLSIIFDGDAEVERYWNMFLRSYYLTSNEPGSVPRRRFHNETGIPDSQVDWDLWRAIRRGTP